MLCFRQKSVLLEQDQLLLKTINYIRFKIKTDIFSSFPAESETPKVNGQFPKMVVIYLKSVNYKLNSNKRISKNKIILKSVKTISDAMSRRTDRRRRLSLVRLASLIFKISLTLSMSVSLDR